MEELLGIDPLFRDRELPFDRPRMDLDEVFVHMVHPHVFIGHILRKDPSYTCHLTVPDKQADLLIYVAVHGQPLGP